MSKLPLFTLLLALCSTLAFVHGDDRQAQQSDPWHLASMQFINESYQSFEEGVEEDPANRELLYGHALLLINHPPKEAGKIEKARSIFEDLAKETDEIGLASRFFQARILQFHQSDSDPKAAAEAYLKLFKEYPETFWGQFAALKHFTLEVHALNHGDASAAKLPAFAQDLKVITDPVIRRNYLVALGDAHLLYGGLNDEDALSYFMEARKIGFTRPEADRDCLLRSIELAKRIGRPQLAIHVMDTFVHQFPSDSWAYMISQDLEAMRKEVGR